MGATAIRSAVAFPGLRLTGVITSSAAKVGMDAATFAGLAAPTGVAATTDVETVLAGCDAVAYMGIYDGLDVPLHRPLPAEVESERWSTE